MAYTIDTLAAVRELTAAGLPGKQAEAIVSTVSRAGEAQSSHLATKADLAALEVRLLKWGVGIAVATAGLLFAALRLVG